MRDKLIMAAMFIKAAEDQRMIKTHKNNFVQLPSKKKFG